jgi:hypothetical protein
VEVILYHKPRGCKGVWQKVDEGDALRVTKGKGKWLKLDVKSQHEFSVDSMEVYLLDVSGGGSIQLVHDADEGFTIENISTSGTTNGTLVEVEMKLDRVCRQLQFYATISLRTTNGTVVYKGRSVEFSAHNNGKTHTGYVYVRNHTCLIRQSCLHVCGLSCTYRFCL